jgi:hypothetical protein
VDFTQFLVLVLLITFTYWLATLGGHDFQSNHLVACLGRREKTLNNFPHHSIFLLGLSGYAWSQSLVVWRDRMLALMALKPHTASEFSPRTKCSIPFTAIVLTVLSHSQQ